MQQLISSVMASLKRALGIGSYTNLAILFSPHSHSPLLVKQREAVIISRVRMVAVLFAVLTLSWIVIDYLVFPGPVVALLALGRILTSISLGFLAFWCRGSSDMRIAYRVLAIMFTIPTIFFLFSHYLLSQYDMSGAAVAVATGYAFLPFVLGAGLSLFPLTALEGLLFALPVLAVQGLSALLSHGLSAWNSHLGALGLLLFIVVVAIMAGVSQLAFMAAMVEQGARDPLTGGFNRSSGAEMLGVLYRLAHRNQVPLSIVFADLDNFKQVNDLFGHQEGDRMLVKFAASMISGLRESDLLLRWGGEEFLLVLPNTSCEDAAAMVNRLRLQGFGLRPDDSPQTASFGIAEHCSDQAANWEVLVALADQRMYQAKQAGKNTVVGC